MPVVEMLKKTNTPFGPKEVGDTFEVDEATAARWFRFKIAQPATEKKQEKQKEKALEEMNLKELYKFAKDNDIDPSGLSKEDKKDVDKVREYIQKALTEGQQGGE